MTAKQGRGRRQVSSMDFGFITLLTGMVSSPTVTLRHIAQAAPFGLAVWTLLGLGVLLVLGGVVSGLMPYSRSSTYLTAPIWAGLVIGIGMFLIPCLWMWMAAMTKGLLSLFGARASLEAVFCLLVFASIPQFWGWITYALRDLNQSAYRVWQAGMIGGLLWATILVGAGLRAAYGVEGWRLFAASLPLPALIWAAGLAAGLERADSFSAIRRWQKMRGERVVVFAPPDADKRDVEAVVRHCDWAWKQAAQVLQVELPSFRVGVFLFTDVEGHKYAMKSKQKMANGYAHHDCISLCWGNLSYVENIVSHEFTHILARLWTGAQPPALLNEGLAVYINSELLPDANTHKPVIRLPYALRVLAHDTLFYEWINAAHTEYPADDYYSHAHSFARYLIGRSGLALFKQLLREAAPKKTKEDKSKGEGERMADAVRKIYGLSLPELEAEWRQSGKPPHFRLPPKQ